MINNHVRTTMFVLCTLIAGVTAGCGGTGSTSNVAGASSALASSTPSPSTANSSAPSSSTSGSSASAPSAPVISGSPSTKAQVGQTYSFTPTIQSPNGAVAFSIQNKPAWASFSIATGSLSGTPSTSDVGTDSNIVISASNSQKSATLQPFNIAVTNPATVLKSGGATPVFSFPNFASAPSAMHVGSSDASQFNGSVIDVNSGLVGLHEAGAVWYATPQDISTFTTDFAFQIAPGGYGMAFVIQNDPRGLSAVADANGLGYLTYTYNNPDNAITNSVAIVFNATPNSSTAGYYIGANPSVIGLYIDGGPFINNGIFPVNDLSPQGINLHSGDLMSAHVVYDGSELSIELADTTSGRKAYYSWPVNIPAVVGSSNAYIGFGAGTITAAAQTLNSWSWWNGYNTRLPTPTFSPTPGAYSGSQSVAISGPSGATIYYTTDGTPPTTASRVYNGAISVGSNELIQAIAAEPGYTNSMLAQGNYQIQSAGNPFIDFSSGFASANGLVQTAAIASINGSNLQLTDGTNQGEIGSSFYDTPVNVASFTTNFTLVFNGTGTHNGMVFVIQNQMPLTGDTSDKFVSGGPYTFGQGGPGYGYEGIGSSVGLGFDVWNGAVNLYENGSVPSSPQANISGITLSSGHPIACTLTYDGTTLSLSMVDTVTHGTFSKSWPVDIPMIVGADTAYVGFTAATYDSLTIQDVSAWTYHN